MMLIWLGKNKLKQADKAELKQDIKAEITTQRAVLKLPENGNRNLENNVPENAKS